ncbi:hypothetical protein ACHMXB_01135 [Arthrobacter sp. UC242_113]
MTTDNAVLNLTQYQTIDGLQLECLSGEAVRLPRKLTGFDDAW